ncbi:segregation and condensation protein A [Hutsoniella sourekii]
MADYELELELEDFHGPLDLLLHLIKKMEVDINDIPMAEITQQYLTYVRSMQELQLDKVADYLVMAATLIEIKSRLLLPVEPDQDWEDPYQGEDPRATLVEQLLVYQQFQEVSSQLEKLEASRALNYGRPASDLTSYLETVPLKDGELTVDHLVESMQQVLMEQLEREPKHKQIHQDTETVDDKIKLMHDYFRPLSREDRISFDTFVTTGNRREIINSFLAVLELVRKQYLTFYQEEIMAPIYLKKNARGDDDNESFSSY